MTLLAGRYRLVSVLGQGGMGTVWRAADELLRQEVAIKEVLLPPELDADARAELRERTLREARAAARLRSHPSIVTVHDVVLEDGQPWIVMELVRGRSLDKIVHAEGPLPPRRVAAIGLAVLDALGAAHAAGILHRDVKPGNVLITDEGRVLLTDFGIATVAGDPALTQTGLLNGSPGYMAPERLRGEADGPPADLWSLGATLYTAVEGTPAFRRDNANAIMAAVLMHEPNPMRLAGPLAPVLGAILEKDPARRCPATWAAARLHAIAAGAPAPGVAPPGSPRGSAAPPGPADSAGPGGWAHTAGRVGSPVRPVTGPTGPAGMAAPSPHTAPAGRRARGRAPLIVGAVLAVTVPAVTGVLLWGGVISPFGAAPRVTGSVAATGAGRPSVKPGAPGRTARTGLLAANPEACALLTAAQARALLGGQAEERFMTKDACMWDRKDGTFLEIQKTRFETAGMASMAFDAGRSNMKDEPRRYPGTRLREGLAVGDASYGWTRRMAPDSPNYQTMVLFRTANVMVHVYHSGHRPGFATADRMAKLVNAALLAAR
ncbi:serine/threonine-protein kinase [Sphaerisporangium album]|uniref:serine/threonine-protein kinase n=1 Tax=Sphaerisporangium album TaxID=509200 RepID=UPI001FE95474|nr:serine/threonine-protein kinase [Sphaerisporangium album]